ncbi:MAG: hypothetical protein II650_00695, partial [Clostridia bacterium]|nr:hypothetical protein [Clostridia bacterium]
TPSPFSKAQPGEHLIRHFVTPSPQGEGLHSAADDSLPKVSQTKGDHPKVSKGRPESPLDECAAFRI